MRTRLGRDSNRLSVIVYPLFSVRFDERLGTVIKICIAVIPSQRSFSLDLY